MRIIFETHSTSTDNEAGMASGHNDPDLSPLGEQQAAELGERRAAEEIVAVYCSDLRRARRTAEIAFAGRGVPVVADTRLRECNFGELNGAPRDRVHALSAQHVTAPFPGGESYADVVRRVESFLDDALGQHASETVRVIAHRATHHAVEHLLNGRDLAGLIAGDWAWQPGWVYETGLKRS